MTNTNDSGTGSLRQAIATAAPGDTITFDSSLSGQTLTLLTRLSLSKNLTIDGTTLATVLTIDGDSATQLFAVNNGVSATFIGLTLANANANYGGAIYNQGTLTVALVTFADNQAIQGGAIYNVGSLTVENSTFHGNSAFNGGALSNVGTAAMRNSTLIANSSFNPGGGIDNADELALYNTIIAGSTYGSDNTAGGDCVNADNPQLGLKGTLTANVNNLTEDGSCDAAFTGDPALATLGTLDGALVHKPLNDSQAIDAGDSASCLSVDQRNLARPQGSGCDLGAVELAAINLGEGNQVSQDGVTNSYNPVPTACANLGALPIHTISPTLRNSSNDNFRELHFVLTELDYVESQADYHPTLCNADGGNGGGVGATLTFPLTGDLADTIFAPAETVTPAFQVGLPVRRRYRIFGNLFGTPANGLSGRDGTAQQIGTFGWEFDEEGNLVDTTVQIFLPLVAK